MNEGRLSLSAAVHEANARRAGHGVHRPSSVHSVDTNGASKTAEAAEIAFAKRMPVWRALTAVLYRAHAAPKWGRVKAAEAA